jgi:hypothetical protein
VFGRARAFLIQDAGEEAFRMKRNAKNVRALIYTLREMGAQGSLETAKVAQLIKSARALERGLSNNDRKLIESAVGEICRLLLKKLENDEQTEATDA